MELSRSGTGVSLERCPYCHDTVARDEEDVVVCRSCLARHHAACWSESGKCAACQASTPLAAVASLVPGTVVGTVVSEPEDDDARREAARILDEAAPPRESFVATAILTFLTLGLYHLIRAEIDLAAHRAKNRGDPPRVEGSPADLAERIEREHGLATKDESSLGVLRVTFAALPVAPAMLFWVPLFHFLMTLRDDALGAASAFQLVAALGVAGFLHIYRELVVRHEHHQFFARLVGDALDPDRLKTILASHKQAWNVRRFHDGFLSLLALVPIVGLFFLPVLAMRLRGSLDHHERNERSLPERTSSEGKKPAPA